MTQLDIMNGMIRQLKKKWPGVICYTDQVPQGFERPSFLVEVGKIVQEEAGGFDTRFTMEGKITIYLEVDLYHHSHVPSLCKREAEVMALFSHGYFPVGDRSPHVDRIQGDHGYDSAQVTLTISFSERWDGEEEYPLLQSVDIRIE